MAEDPTSPSSLPGEARMKTNSNGAAYLPPRKRLLAGLKENGWLLAPSPPPALSSPWQSPCAHGASFVGLTEQELTLEVDLIAETNAHDCAKETQSTFPKQSADNSSSSVKCNKRVHPKRKHLSVLADCHDLINHVQLDVLDSAPKSNLKNTNGNNACTIDHVSASKPIHGSKECLSSYKEMVHVAKAAAERAAKAAAQARAIALDKAAVAAKAADVARAALEAVALVVCKEDTSELEHASKCMTKCDVRKEEFMSDVLCSADVSGPNNGLSPWLTCGGESRSDYQLDATSSTPPADEPKSRFFQYDQGISPLVLVRSKEEEKSHGNHHSSLQKYSPVADVELARQLHRAMNSSPRISSNKQPLECFKKSETRSSLPTKSTFRKKCQPTRGLKGSMEGKHIHKKKSRTVGVNRMTVPRAEVNVKLKSVSAINEALNMLRGASSSH